MALLYSSCGLSSSLLHMKLEKEHRSARMNKVERIARDLAAVLSPQGEPDWPRFIPLAREVGARLDRQFSDLMTRVPGDDEPTPSGPPFRRDKRRVNGSL